MKNKFFLKDSWKHHLFSFLINPARPKIPKWSSYNRLGKSRTIKSSYIWFIFVPIVAKALSLVNPELNITLLNESIVVNFGLPFSWVIFYFSSTFFAVASLIYQIKCPELIKDYSSFQEFIKEGKTEEQIRFSLIQLIYPRGVSYMSQFTVEPKNIQNVVYFIDIFLENSNDDNTKIKNTTGYHLDNKAKDNPLTIINSLRNSKIAENKLANAFWYVRQCADINNYIIRSLCGLCYGIGFILISIIFFQNILYVLEVSF